MHAVPIVVIVLSLFYYWFVLADRYVVFLYNHLKAGPFGPSTISRYWMSGLVASGAVMVGYTVLNWFGGRIAGAFYRAYPLPSWWQVWALCIPPLAIGILVITMTGNQPVLPLSVALACLASTLIGLGLALWPSSLAVNRPSEFIWLGLCGLGLVPPLLLLRSIELPALGLASSQKAYGVAIASAAAGTAWLALMAFFRALRRDRPLRPGRLMIAGLCVGYLFMPLGHYLVLVPPAYRYITTSANFFAANPVVQLLCLGATALLAIGSTRLEDWFKACLAKRWSVSSAT